MYIYSLSLQLLALSVFFFLITLFFKALNLNSVEFDVEQDTAFCKQNLPVFCQSDLRLVAHPLPPLCRQLLVLFFIVKSTSNCQVVFFLVMAC